MIEFVSRTVRFGQNSIEAACLVTPAEAMADDGEKLSRDGEVLDVAPDMVTAFVRAIKATNAIESQGNAVDCSAFGTILLGGIYNPIPEATYRNGVTWSIRFGRWLTKEEAFGDIGVSSLVEFGAITRGGFTPAHAAIKLPVTDTYLQKLGHSLPIALTSTAETCNFMGANTCATVDRITALHRGDLILEYRNPNPEPVARIPAYYGAAAEIED